MSDVGTDPEAVVRRFFELLCDRRADEAVALLAEDVEWRNAGLPTVRGKRRVGGMLRDMDRRRIHFDAEMHHVAADGEHVLTQRTDYLGYGRFAGDFWVYGTFRVREGLIELWDDHFSIRDFLLGMGRGAVRALRGPGRSAR